MLTPQLCVNKQPTRKTRKLDKEKKKFDVKKPVGEKLRMYHVESLNKEMGDANKSLMEESIISKYNKEFHLEQLSCEECEETEKSQHFFIFSIGFVPIMEIKKKKG